MTTIFKMIIDREIPAQIVYEDDLCLAFKDIHPAAPVHILVIPKITEIDRLSSANQTQQSLLGHLLLICNLVAKEAGLADFRVVTNNGENAGQSVFHLHFHVIGGRELDWPPG